MSSSRSVVDDSHERGHHAGGVLVLDDIAAIHDAGNALLDECLGAGQNLRIRSFAASADKDRNASSGFDDFVVDRNVIRGIGLDDIGAEFHRLADEVLDFDNISINHVATRLAIRAEDERFHHHGHAIVVALQLERADVFNALVRDSWRSGNLEKIHAHASGIESNGLKTRFLDHRAQRLDGQLAAIDICHIRAENERRLLTARDFLQMAGLASGELNGIWRCIHNSFHRLRHVLDACEKARLIKKAMIDGDIKAAAGFGVEETVEAVVFHKMCKKVQ